MGGAKGAEGAVVPRGCRIKMHPRGTHTHLHVGELLGLAHRESQRDLCLGLR